MEEIPIQLLILNRRAVACHAIDDQPLNFILFNRSNNLMEVSVQVQFLGALEIDGDHARIDLCLKVESQCRCITTNLGGVLIKGDQKTSHALFDDAFEQ